MAESLKDFQKRVQFADAVFVYERAVDNMRDPTQAEYNALPSEIKAQYKNYGEYVSAIRQQNNTTKQAIKDKLNLMKTENQNSNFNADEKAQYDNDMESVKNKCDGVQLLGDSGDGSPKKIR